MTPEAIARAGDLIQHADALLIGAGAGMGVDSGLPDFRGPEGFWNAYPPYRHLKLGFTDMANPRWFASDPAFAWGFYGHRRNLYRRTRPHPGFAILRRWIDRMPGGGFVFTSNVDGHFQQAGFDPERIVEVHGAIDWNQCTQTCSDEPFPAEAEDVEIDESTMKALEPLPACPGCGALARPNILMFGDWDWMEERTRRQQNRLERWLSALKNRRLAVVEIGAGTAVPTVRLFCEQEARVHHGSLIRINSRESQVPSPAHVGLGLGCLDALRAIEEDL